MTPSAASRVWGDPRTPRIGRVVRRSRLSPDLCWISNGLALTAPFGPATLTAGYVRKPRNRFWEEGPI